MSNTCLSRVLIPLLLAATLAAADAALGGDLRVLTEISGRSAMLQDDQLSGWGVEIVREIMRRTGSQGGIEPLPWGRAYETALHTPNVALFSTTRTEERDDLFHWIGPLFRLEWNFVAAKRSHLQIRSLDDARRVRAIGTYINDARDRFLVDQGFTNLDRTASNVTNYRKLDYGRLDLIVSTNVGVLDIAREAGVDPDNLEVVYTIKEMDMYLAISKGSDPNTVAAWQSAFEAMRRDGTFAAILRKYHPEIEVPLDDRLPWRTE